MIFSLKFNYIQLTSILLNSVPVLFLVVDHETEAVTLDKAIG